MPHHLVAKEQIPFHKLKNEEVLTSSEERRDRDEQLQRAVQLNRNAYSKARITFDTADDTLEVIAHVWEITDKNVLLQGGITLPVCCIREVNLEDVRTPQSSLSNGH